MEVIVRRSGGGLLQIKTSSSRLVTSIISLDQLSNSLMGKPQQHLVSPTLRQSKERHATSDSVYFQSVDAPIMKYTDPPLKATTIISLLVHTGLQFPAKFSVSHFYLWFPRTTLH